MRVGRANKIKNKEKKGFPGPVVGNFLLLAFGAGTSPGGGEGILYSSTLLALDYHNVMSLKLNCGSGISPCSPGPGIPRGADHLLHCTSEI